MANNIKRVICEEGVVLEKIHKDATEEFKGQDGRVVPAQPDRYSLKVISGESFKKETGFSNSTVLEYKVDKALFDKVLAYTPVVVKYELSTYGTKPVSLTIKN